MNFNFCINTFWIALILVLGNVKAEDKKLDAPTSGDTEDKKGDDGKTPTESTDSTQGKIKLIIRKTYQKTDSEGKPTDEVSWIKATIIAAFVVLVFLILLGLIMSNLSSGQKS
ncbi:hypothetical protein EDEG_00336 [Edhazardia aedis USNM 41457]|uniref:Stress-associated endoplasmic reticulum protein n=1 Tax=Edhazardia aedis (strain USNM 41457) TaxID=1003232 RepID=J9D223_EDHAE|nr:hypothetical protein EDEG_00336 [Edhazardia aedis USNM 41457]|eukprot:EJW01906.1 hypothetical protein EDEG_00336 [Edhazardia aedis USNM 41457]